MRILSVVIQNRKGENVVMVTAGWLSMQTCDAYARQIFKYLLQIYRKDLKIERTFTLEPRLRCVLSIYKEYFLYVFSTPQDLSLAFEAIRKTNDFLSSNVKMFAGLAPAARVEVLSKRFVQCISSLEDFLYSRQIPLKDFLPLTPQPQSRKKGVDLELSYKFVHIAGENDRRSILDSQVISSRLEGLAVKKKIKMIDRARRMVIRNLEDEESNAVDEKKENFLKKYRRSIQAGAICGRQRQPFLPTTNKSIPVQLLSEQLPEVEEEVEKQKLFLRMLERLELTMQNAKIKEVHQIGQIIVEGNGAENSTLNLLGASLWENPKLLNRRISPASASDAHQQGLTIKFKTVPMYRTKPIVDYVIRRETFTPEKIPLLFLYVMEVSSSNIEFTLKYKVGEKWKHRLYDVDISVHLNSEFMVMDCKSIPNAHSLKNNRITWKTKEIIPNSPNAKGKIILAFASTNIHPNRILKEIRLTMKAHTGLIDNLGVNCQQGWGNIAYPQKVLTIDYKINPNT